MSDNHPLRTLVLGTVISGLILAIFLWLAGFLPAIWHALKSASIWFFHFLVSSFPIPVWSIVFIFILIVPTLIKLFSRFSKKDVNHPNWRDYNEDEILKMRWRWRYTSYGGNIENIVCFCPSDDTQLIYEDWGSQVVFRCETCRRQFGPIQGSHGYIIGMIERQIQRKLRTGEWKEVVQRLIKLPPP